VLISRNPSRPGQISRIRLRRRKVRSDLSICVITAACTGAILRFRRAAGHNTFSQTGSPLPWGLGGCTPHRTSTVISKRVARQIATKAVIFVAAPQNGSKDCNGAWEERGREQPGARPNSRGHKRDNHRQDKQVAELTKRHQQCQQRRLLQMQRSGLQRLALVPASGSANAPMSVTVAMALPSAPFGCANKNPGQSRG